MLECFLFVHHAGARWAPLIAIPGVIAGGAASISLLVSGIKGLIAKPRRRRINRADSPERVVRWIGKRPVGNGWQR